MGRTVPTFRAAMEESIGKWEGYRKALRQDEREVFDRMMDLCRLHVSAAGHAARPDPVEAMFLSILLEHQKKLEAIESKLNKIMEGMRRE